MYCKTTFLVIDTTLTSNNPFLFSCNILERIYRLIMKINDEIRDEKLPYDINSEAEKRSAVSSGKIDKYEFLTGEEILPPYQSRMKEQAMLLFLQKNFRKTNKQN